MGRWLLRPLGRRPLSLCPASLQNKLVGKRRRWVDTSVPEHEEEVGPSRSKQREARKALKARLESIAFNLTRLPERALSRLELGDAIDDEVGQLREMSVGPAFARQRRRLVGLLRELDLDELEGQIEIVEGATHPTQASTYRLERIRRSLMENDPRVMEELIDGHPHLDRQRLHQAVRAARQEAAAAKSTRKFKALYQLLKELGLGEAPDVESDEGL